MPRSQTEEEDLARLLQFDNVLFRISNSTRFVHTPNLEKFIQEGILFQMVAFPLVPFTKTALRMYFHLIEAIEKNNGRSTGQKSEG